MAVNLSPIGNDAPFVDSSGNPLTGGLLYWYVSNSTTPQDTYTTSAGNVANANPVVLGSTGYPTVASAVVEIWLTAGVTYKAVLKTAAGVTLWTRDNISGINDTTVTINEWVSGPAPTYISATSFSLVGDQTSTFNVGRRVKTTNSGGTVYSTITASAYAAVTTITVRNDSGTLDSGLSAVSYGLLSASNPSVPNFAGPSSNSGAPAGQLFVRGGQVGFPATQVPSTDPNTLDDYQEDSFTATLNGYTVDPTGTINITKIGNQVTLDIPAFTGTSNSTGKDTTPAMDASYRPATVKLFPALVSDNGGSYVWGRGRVNTDGTLEFFADANGGAWTNSGTAAVGQCVVTYTTA